VPHPLRLGLALGGPLDARFRLATADLAMWADENDFDSIWLPEGHLRPGATASPIVALAALAAITRRVRLGTTSLLISIHEPLRVAAEVATLDQLSAGRAILGVGRGFEPAMFKAFGIDPRDKRDRFDDALDAILAAWSETRRGAEESDAALQPVQRPHPPIWVAAFGSKGLTQAARRGLPYLASPIESFAALVENFAAHAAQLPAGVERDSLPVAVMRTVHVAADGAEALPRAQADAGSRRSRRARAGDRRAQPARRRLGDRANGAISKSASRSTGRRSMVHLRCGRHRAWGRSAPRSSGSGVRGSVRHAPDEPHFPRV
jgi:alkanesulfonate monooxygenase SsuD/methylene tetrahydromethanopterin reductase-like flavin-dependent oxidoreductase (luciferase family)